MKKYFYLILLGAVLLSSCNFDKKEPEPVQKEEEEQLYVGEPLEDWVIYYRIGASSADKYVDFDDDMEDEINEPYKDVIFFDPENADEISLFRILSYNRGYGETFLYLGSRDASKKESDKMHDCHFTLQFSDDLVFEGSGFYDINVKDRYDDGTNCEYYKYRLDEEHLRAGFIDGDGSDIILTYNNRKYTVGSRINLLCEVYNEEGVFSGKKLKLAYDRDYNGEFKNTIFTYFPLFREFYSLDKDTRDFKEFCETNNINGIKYYEYNSVYPFSIDIPKNSLWYDERTDHKFDNIYLSLVFSYGYRAYGKVK